MSLGMMSLMTGLAQGYEKGQDQQYDRARQARMDQIALDRAGREQMEFDQTQQERQGLQDAARPVMAVPAPAMDNGGVTIDDQGNPLPQQAPMVTVGGQRLGADVAGPALAAANSPEAKQARQLAFMANANPAKALRMQSEVARAQADTIDSANKKWNADVDTARSKGWDGLVELTSSSHADGQGGAVKSKAVVSPDGKTVSIQMVGPDGELMPSKMPAFPNTDEGLDQAALMLQKGVPMQARLAHWEHVNSIKRQEQRDIATAADKKDDNVRQAARDKVDADYKMGMLGIAGQKADAGDRKADGGGGSMEDRMAAKGELAAYNASVGRVKEMSSLISKAKAENNWEPDKNPSQKSLQTDLDQAIIHKGTLERRYTQQAPGVDPYSVRPSKPGAMPSMSGGDMKVGADTQVSRDGQAGLQMITSEYGGDLNAARKGVEQLRAAASTLKGDAKPMAMEQANLLQAGIDAREKTKGKVSTTVVKPTQSVTVNSPKMATAGDLPARDIPPPPEPTIVATVRTSIGMVTKPVPNPEYVTWQRTYGDAYEERNRQERAAANAAARSNYRPEAAPYQRRGV